MIITRAQPRGAKGAEAPPSRLSKSKLRKMIISLNFVHTTRSKCYCNIIIPSQLSNFFRILAREGAIFVQILDIFEFFASWWSNVAWFGQFVVLQINYDIIKLQKYQLWRPLPNLCYQNDVTKFFDFQAPSPPSKVLVAPLGSNIWSVYRQSTFNRLKVGYNNAHRILFNLPRQISISTVLVQYHISTFYALVRRYAANFMLRCEKSRNIWIYNLVRSGDFRSGPFYDHFVKLHENNFLTESGDIDILL